MFALPLKPMAHTFPLMKSMQKSRQNNAFSRMARYSVRPECHFILYLGCISLYFVSGFLVGDGWVLVINVVRLVFVLLV